MLRLLRWIRSDRPIMNHVRNSLSVCVWRWRSKRKNFAKRAIDILGAGLALLAVLPLGLMVAAIIKITDRGPVFFWQARVGKDGRNFRFPKFRSMITNAEKVRATIEASNAHGSDGVTFKMKRDPRVTRIGRLIRRTSFDEIPQLWCVLKGDMSLVGPRPALPGEVARYSVEDRDRLSVTPGLTCIWQVSGRSDIPFPQQVVMDVDYVKTQCLSSDIKLLIATIPAVVSGRGAY
jgi:lipopolysaccharide/colanic/teichoic acid biosynthesis glycosyltransferase